MWLCGTCTQISWQTMRETLGTWWVSRWVFFFTDLCQFTWKTGVPLETSCLTVTISTWWFKAKGGGSGGGIWCMLCLPGDAAMLTVAVTLVASKGALGGESFSLWLIVGVAMSPCAYIILSVWLRVPLWCWGESVWEEGGFPSVSSRSARVCALEGESWRWNSQPPPHSSLIWHWFEIVPTLDECLQ